MLLTKTHYCSGKKFLPVINQTLSSLSWLIHNHFIAVSSVYGILSAAVCCQHKGVSLVEICTESFF